MTDTITGAEAAKQAALQSAVGQFGALPAGLGRGRIIARGIVALVLALTGSNGVALASDPGPSAGATPWQASSRAAARLLAAGPAASASGPAAALAGLEIRLDPGFITYWRDPGEAGLPPHLDTSASENVASVTVDFPAPQRLDEGGTLAYGYDGGVILPLRVTPTDPARPSVLAVDLDYAVCGKVCLPASAHLRLPLPDRPEPEEAALLHEAVSRVPRVAQPDAPGPLAVVSADPASASAIEVTTRAGPDATLFVEPPEGWFLQPGAGQPTGAGRLDFHVVVLQKPEGARLDGLDLRFTLVDASGAIEVPVRMKGAGDPP